MRLFHFKSRTIFSIFRLGMHIKQNLAFGFLFFFLLSFFLSFFTSLVSLSVALYLRDTLVLRTFLSNAYLMLTPVLLFMQQIKIAV